MDIIQIARYVGELFLVHMFVPLEYYFLWLIAHYGVPQGPDDDGGSRMKIRGLFFI